MTENTKAPYGSGETSRKRLPERGLELSGSVSADPAATPLNQRITQVVTVGKVRFSVEFDEKGADAAMVAAFRMWA